MAHLVLRHAVCMPLDTGQRQVQRQGGRFSFKSMKWRVAAALPCDSGLCEQVGAAVLKCCMRRATSRRSAAQLLQQHCFQGELCWGDLHVLHALLR